MQTDLRSLYPVESVGVPPATTPGADERRARTIILLLTASVALLMSGYGIVYPIFAQRLGELGAGVDALGLMTMALALGQFLLAPVMGALADRFGRRPVVLIALSGLVLANGAFLLAQSATVFIAVRFAEGAITAGLLPAAMAIVADLMPENRRAQWVGIVMGGYGAGFIFGPAIGGFLYDAWGFAAPFLISAGLGLIALLFAAVKLPETRPATATRSAAMDRAEPRPRAIAGRGALWTSLPRPLYVTATLLFLDFLVFFGFAFVEPQMVFYLYDGLGFSATQFGLIVGAYGLTVVLGQTTLGRLSDRFGRRPPIALGLLLMATFYLALTGVTDFGLLCLAAAVAGIGEALIMPALSAFYLDITAEGHRSRILGLKESAAALGGITGPLLVALVSRWTTPHGVFTIAATLTALAVVLALVALRVPRRGRGTPAPPGADDSSDRTPLVEVALGSTGQPVR